MWVGPPLFIANSTDESNKVAVPIYLCNWGACIYVSIFFIPFEFNYQEFLKIPGYLLLIGIPLFRGIPNNRGDGTFFSIPVLRNHGNWGPDNRGPPVFSKD